MERDSLEGGAASMKIGITKSPTQSESLGMVKPRTFLFMAGATEELRM